MQYSGFSSQNYLVFLFVCFLYHFGFPLMPTYWKHNQSQTVLDVLHPFLCWIPFSERIMFDLLVFFFSILCGQFLLSYTTTCGICLKPWFLYHKFQNNSGNSYLPCGSISTSVCNEDADRWNKDVCLDSCQLSVSILQFIYGHAEEHEK